MNQALKKLASVRITVVLLFLLALLVVWGTLYQAEHGLYAAQQRFYQSYVFMIMGVIPFPGTQLVLTALFFNLLSAMLVTLQYRWKKAGLVLTHAGLLVLLVGGFVIKLYVRESSLTLEEGEGSNVSQSYQDWEIAIGEQSAEDSLNTAKQSGRRVISVSTSTLKPSHEISIKSIGAQIEVETYYPNAKPVSSADNAEAPSPLNSSGIADLTRLPRGTKPSTDIPGGIFRIQGPEGESSRVLLYGADRASTALVLDGKTYDFALRRKRYPLPYTVVLNDFQRVMHPGSSMAQSYASEVTVYFGETSRRVRIAMNEPLRYQGYTLFQSSYQELGDGREFSTFAVVSNHGRYLPYAGSLIIFAGMLIHFMTATYSMRLRKP